MTQPAGVRRPLQNEPDWPAADGGRTVFLLDAASGLERRILESWIERRRPVDQSPAPVDVLRASPPVPAGVSAVPRLLPVPPLAPLSCDLLDPTMTRPKPVLVAWAFTVAEPAGAASTPAPR